ncbi:hypothetical protein Efla_003432 [Eimeria flavescens]
MEGNREDPQGASSPSVDKKANETTEGGEKKGAAEDEEGEKEAAAGKEEEAAGEEEKEAEDREKPFSHFAASVPRAEQTERDEVTICSNGKEEKEEKEKEVRIPKAAETADEALLQGKKEETGRQQRNGINPSLYSPAKATQEEGEGKQGKTGRPLPPQKMTSGQKERHEAIKREEAAGKEVQFAASRQRLQELIEQAEAELKRAKATRASFLKAEQLKKEAGQKLKALSIMERRTKALESRLDVSAGRIVAVNLQNQIVQKEMEIQALQEEIKNLQQHNARNDAIYEQLSSKLGGLPKQASSCMHAVSLISRPLLSQQTEKKEVRMGGTCVLNFQIKEQNKEMLQMREQCREQKKAAANNQQKLQQLIAAAAELDRDYLRKKAALDIIARRRRNEEVTVSEYDFPLRACSNDDSAPPMPQLTGRN